MSVSNITELINQVLNGLSGVIPALGPLVEYINGKPVLETLVLVVLAATAVLIVNYLYFFIMKAAGIIAFSLKSRFGKKNRTRPVKPLKGPADPLAVTIRAIKYLTKKKEWQYATPWYLMTGDENSRKTELLAALDSGRRQRLLLKEKSLVVKDTGWNFYNNGIVIDIDDDVFDPEKQGENRWDNILSGISYNRPERAADGIILTVSALELLENENRMDKKGYLFYKRFLKIQEVFALSLPVYLIVTGCEEVEGFGAFWKTQNPGHLDDLFGWSNPYTADTAFLPEWIDTAFEQIFSRLQDAQINSVSGKKPITDPDRFFLFPYHFSKMRPALKRFTSAIFKPASYHTSFLLRGVYFTGAREWGEPEASEGSGHTCCFAKRLFERKIFAEKNLAVPIRKQIISRNKIIRNFQFAMIGIALVLISVFIVDETRLISQIRNIKETSEALQNASVDCSDGGSRVLAVLEKLTQIDGNPSYISFIASWYDKLPLQIARYIADKCLESVYTSLECRIKTKAEQVNKNISGVPGPGYSVFIAELEEIQAFEENLNRFMALCDDAMFTGDKQILDEFKLLLNYLYTDKVPAALMRQKGMHVKTLKEIRYTPSWQTSDFKGGYLPQRDRAHLSTPIPRPADVREWVMEMSEAVRITLVKNLEIPPGIYPPAGKKKNRSPDKPLVAAEKMGLWLDEVITRWGNTTDGTSPCLQLETAVENLKASLVKSGYGPGAFHRALQSFGNTCTQKAGETLSRQLICPDGQLFSMTVDSGLAVKPAAMTNDIALDTLVQTGFMQYRIKAIDYRPGIPAAWDKSKLELAVKYYREYESFIKKDFGQDTPESSPEQTDAFYKRLAKQQVALVLEQLVYEAQIGRGQSVHTGPVFQPVSSEEAFLNADIGNLTQSKELIQELLSICGLNDFDYTRVDLLNASEKYSLNLLDTCNRLLNSANPYRPVPDPEWTNENFTAVLFNITSKEQLKNYLEAQRKRILYISSNYARPVIEFLLSISESNTIGKYDLYKKWYQTLTEIDKYEKHDPGSRIPFLENYFTGTLAQKNIHTYDPKKDEALSGSDVFTRSFNRISTKIANQAGEYDRTGIDRSYQALASLFNTYLKGRYPFVGERTAETGEADLNRISEFIRTGKNEMDSLEKTFSAMPENSYSEQARDFVRQMQEAVNFLSPLLGTGGAPGSLIIEPEFRKLATPSDGTNQIIEWRLNSGASSVTYPRSAENKSISWMYGQEVGLGLRWASGSAVKPVSTAGHGQPEISNETATFRYGGPWALLRFLTEHGKAGSNPEKKAGILTGFEIPVVKKEEAGNGESSMETVKLFVNVQLAVQDPKTGLSEKIAFPERFPGYVPELKQAAGAE
ncbi:MAG: type VI secretion system protein [Desulfobacterales bacterium]|nr:type VI secretion system protein [Desulfobacterales bacterium]